MRNGWPVVNSLYRQNYVCKVLKVAIRFSLDQRVAEGAECFGADETCFRFGMSSAIDICGTSELACSEHVLPVNVIRRTHRVAEWSSAQSARHWGCDEQNDQDDPSTAEKV